MPILTNKLGLTSYNTITDASSVSFYTFFNQSSGSATTQNLGILDRYATDTSACIARGFAESSASTTILSASVAILNGDVVKVRFLNSDVPPTPSTGCSILYFDTSGSMHAFNSGSNINITNTLMNSPYQKFDRKGDLYISTGSKSGSILASGGEGQYLKVTGSAPAGVAWVSDSWGLNIILGNIVGGVITAGSKVAVEMPFSGSITSVRMFADTSSGSVSVEIKKATYSNYPTLTIITGSASKPTITVGNAKMQDATLSNWTRTFDAGDVITFDVKECATIKQVTVSLRGSKD